ncbi:hypothetical protein L1987_58662 [Smallanthus sonchifolius]|uniref:Uncharacterized protein n=1 Tax=Smallanthus sonchifolius TaxID=185202 RepID=A0ACB9D3E4_9ASTR|nr:hypothetical protein L1987_58662 [Smallanthus sonchifolius]
MPRKKEPPPSSLPPRRSTRGASKSTSLIDEEEVETPKVPLLGLGDYQEDSAGSLRPPSLLSGSNVCHINKENSFVSSVTVSLDESKQGLGSINKDNFLENCDAAGILPAGKTGLAGMSDSDGSPGVLGSFHRDGQEKTSSAVAGSLVARKSDPAGELCLDGNIAGQSESDSSGSPGVPSLNPASGSNSGYNSSSMNDSKGLRYTGTSSRRTPLFSPEFKAMLGRDYPKTRTVFSPIAPVTEEAEVAPTQVESERVRVSPSLDVHGALDEQGGKLDPGIVFEVGVQATCVPDGEGVPMQTHDVNDNLEINREVLQCLHAGVHEQIRGVGGLSQGVGEMARKQNPDHDGLDIPKHMNDKVQVEGFHGLQGVYGEVEDEVFHGMNRESGLHAPSNVVHGALDEVPMQPTEAAMVAPVGGDGIKPGVSDSPKAPAEGAPLSQSPVWDNSLTTSVSYADRCKGSRGSDGPGKNKAIKLQRKKKQVVVRANAIGLKANQRFSSSSGDLSNKEAGPNCANLAGSGFDFVRAVHGTSDKPNKSPTQAPITSSQAVGSASRAASRPPLHSGTSMEVDPPHVCSNNRFAALNGVSELDPFDQSIRTGTNFAELDLHASIKRTSLVEAASDLYPHEPMNEDVPSASQVQSDMFEQAAEHCHRETENLVCQVNREHIEGARLLPASILASPSPGGIHTNEGGRTYGISEAQRKAIVDRLSVSSSICGEETVNWCPGEWDYFNDLCISLGLDPDYCIEDVESDTENGTAKFFSDLWKSGCPKSIHNDQFSPKLVFGWWMLKLGMSTTHFDGPTNGLKGDRWKGGDIPATLGLNPYVEGATDDGITNLSPVDEATVMDTEMEGLKHTSCPANTQVTDNNYGMYSPRKDSNNTQSIIWDSKNGHYNILDRTQGNDSGSSDCDLNTQPDTHQMVNSVWNSPGSGLESFVDKIKKSNELTGLKLEYFPPRYHLMGAAEFTYLRKI